MAFGFGASSSVAPMSSPPRPFDAVLVVSFGGPEGLADIRPFLANVLRGRRVPPERIEAVAHHYELFGGVSPLTAITRRQVEGLQTRLAAAGLPLPVYLGMRNWHPLLADTLRSMAAAGVRRAIGFISAAHRSYSSCTQYRQNVIDARAEIFSAGHRDVEVTYVGDWHTHPGFIEANATHIRAARERLPEPVRGQARIIFTAHSIPLTMTGVERYQSQLRDSARLVAEHLGVTDWALVYQSRSGRPDDPWLEPDICDYLRAEHARGLPAAVLCPIGFLCDHIEVLYDLDHEAADVARQLGLPLARADAVNDDPQFLDTMADLVVQTWRRYQHGIPLAVAPTAPPERVEGPPLRRHR
jgi:ferrochelatase